MHEISGKSKFYVASLSGGKDSTAMLLRLVEEKWPLDLVLFYLTGLEFFQMYEHVKKLEQSIQLPIVWLKEEKGFEYYFLHHKPKRKNPNYADKTGVSWAGPRSRWCTKVLKIQVINKYLTKLKKDYEIVQYIGIAVDEPQRVKQFRYPLVEWGMTEKDCLQYCYQHGYDWGGMYELFNRVSCWCCPLQGLEELRTLRKHFPELWNQLLNWESRTWRNFRADYSVDELEIRFQLEEKWLYDGKAIKGRAFFLELNEKLGRHG